MGRLLLFPEPDTFQYFLAEDGEHQDEHYVSALLQPEVSEQQEGLHLESFYSTRTVLLQQQPLPANIKILGRKSNTFY